MLILGIETTCDETAAAIVEDGKIIWSNIIASQADLHAKYGGVVPEVASRLHLERLPIVIDEALKQANLTMDQIDAIAIATTPGLPPALSVGYSYSSGLALSVSKPLLEINHLKAHVWANFLEFKNEKPVIANTMKQSVEVRKIPENSICLLVSGGHTQLILLKDDSHKKVSMEFEIIAETVDDAAGECFDKVARVLDLSYPGGVNLEKLAKLGDENKFTLPHPMTGHEFEGNLNFSFSGLKTHVIKLVKDLKESGKFEEEKSNVAASFQKTAVDILCQKTIEAANKFEIKQIYLSGGVAGNNKLRETMANTASQFGIKVNFPPQILCTDNAAMIAGVAYNSIISR